MKRISLTVHAVLDVLTVVLFALAPAIFGFEGLAAGLCYALAGAHSLVTVASPSPVGFLGVLPMKVHGAIELVVGPTLMIGVWFLPLAAPARAFFIAAGLAIVGVWAMTHYRQEEEAAGEDAKAAAY